MIIKRSSSIPSPPLPSEPQLQHLELEGCRAITDEGLMHLKNLPLQHLNLNLCEFSKYGLAHLQSLQQLKHLNLAYCGNITDVGLANLLTLPLQHLDLERSNITRAGLVQLKKLTQLEYLNVTNVGRILQRNGTPRMSIRREEKYVGNENILRFLHNGAK